MNAFSEEHRKNAVAPEFDDYSGPFRPNLKRTDFSKAGLLKLVEIGGAIIRYRALQLVPGSRTTLRSPGGSRDWSPGLVRRRRSR